MVERSHRKTLHQLGRLNNQELLLLWSGNTFAFGVFLWFYDFVFLFIKIVQVHCFTTFDAFKLLSFLSDNYHGVSDRGALPLALHSLVLIAYFDMLNGDIDNLRLFFFLRL